MSRVIVLAALSVFLLVACGGPTRDELLSQREDQKFQEIVDKYSERYFTDFPHRAAEAGIHDYDGQLPAFTRDSLRGHVDVLKVTLNELADIDTGRLSGNVRYDHQIFEANLRGRLLELSEIRSWMQNPVAYNDVIIQSILALTDFHHASPEVRLRSVVRRLDQVPDLLGAMKSNLENPAPIFIDVAREQFASTAAFLKNDLATAFADVQDQALKESLGASIGKGVKAYDDALNFLREDWSRRARGGYSIGPRFFQQKILYEEFVETPVADLTKAGEAELRRLQSEMQAVANQISPGRSLAQTLEALASDYPKAEELAPLATTLTADLRRFVTERNLVTIPPDKIPEVRVLKPFASGLLFARMDLPGPLENSTASYYTITLPDTGWSEPRKQQHLKLLNRSALPLLSIHETYPGHYLQFLHDRQAGSKVRKVFGSQAFREGWASYAEQMMLDEGYGNRDPKLRLAQLQFAVLRAARFLTAIRLHGQGTMTEADITNFFAKEAYLSRENALRESRRVVFDPSVFSYTLGHMEILRLRDDYRKARGAEFTLKDFHDNLLKHGYPPLKIVREILLPDQPKTSS